MYRNFDNWNRYYDLDGRVLYGCVAFMLKDGNTSAPIFDSDKTPISNPQITDILGRTEHQVFVDSDVVAYFYKYIGQGTLSEEEMLGIDVSDSSKWYLQYTSEALDEVALDITSYGYMCVESVAALRALDPDTVPTVGTDKVVCLLGYYEEGDCAPVLYIYDPEDGVSIDDNGSILKPSDRLTGRWKLVRPEVHCDSRHFGVFGQDSSSSDVDHTTRIRQLVAYCNTESLRPFFNGSMSAPYFIYDNLTIGSRNPVEVSDSTVFVDTGTCSFYGDWIGEPSFLNGNTDLECRFARTSWNYKTVSGYEKVVIDSTTVQTSFSDAEIVVTVKTGLKTFTNCVIVSDGKLGTNTFRHCRLTQSMFDVANGYPNNVNVDSTCDIDVDDFAIGGFYASLWNQLGLSEIDMQGKELTSADTVKPQATGIRNAVFSNFDLHVYDTVAFDGCKGSITVTMDNAGGGLYFEDSELELTLVSTGVEPDVFSVSNSQLVLNSDIEVNAFSAKCSTFSTGNNSLVLDYGDFAAVDCTVGVNASASGELWVKGCNVSQTITAQAVGSLSVQFVDNFVIGAGKLSIAPTGTNVRASASICNNVGTSPTPIELDHAHLDPTDANHAYVYENNSGTFPPGRVSEFDATLDVVDTFAEATQADDKVQITKDSTDVGPSVHFRDDAAYDTITNPGFHHGFSNNVPFFRFGTDPYNVTVTWRADSTTVQTGDFCSYMAPVAFRMQALYVSDCMWKLVVINGPYSMGGMNSYDTHIAMYMLNAGTSWSGVSFTGHFAAMI